MTEFTSNALTDLAYEHSREALVLYLGCLVSGEAEISIHALSVGLNLDRDLVEKAIHELVQSDFLEVDVVEAVIAQLPNGGTVTDSMRVVRPKHKPVLLERLSANEWANLRRQVFERDDYTCRYCGKRGGALECDHVEPISKGGTNELGNLVTACSGCNKSKRDKQLQDWQGRSS